LLLLAQQRQKNSSLESLHDELILARTPASLLAPADVFAATIATLQSNHFVRRVSVLFDCAVVLLIALLGLRAVRASRVDVVLGLIAFTAAYCLIAFTLMARYTIWVPGIVPLGTTWLLGLLAFVWPRPRHRAEATDIAASPPAP
jgi:predicted DNA repair protein MutK